MDVLDGINEVKSVEFLKANEFINLFVELAIEYSCSELENWKCS